jgi:hypothetical protein
VATGAEGSGTRVTAGLVLDLAGVEPAERVALAPADALEALLAGEVDAIFEVAGAPVELFRSDRIDPARFHLLPLADPVLRAVYAPAEVAAGTYPFAPEAVPVVAVRAMLVTYDYQPGRNPYQAESCALVAEMSHLIATRFDDLKASRHPKWRSVDVRDIPPGWDVSACVLAGLAPEYRFTCRRPDGTVVEEGGSGDANALFLERACPRMGC